MWVATTSEERSLSFGGRGNRFTVSGSGARARRNIFAGARAEETVYPLFASLETALRRWLDRKVVSH